MYQDQTLLNGSSLAQCDPVTLVTPLDAEAPLAQKTAPQLQDVIAAARTNLSNKEIQELEELITQYGDAFVMKGSDYGQSNKVYYCIDAGDARLI
jgi:hypothetical protein